MTKFQLGLLLGCFLGFLVMVVALGIIQLSAEERQERRTRAREKTAREIQAAIGAWPSAHHDSCDHLSFPALEESGPEAETTICYLSIRIE